MNRLEEGGVGKIREHGRVEQDFRLIEAAVAGTSEAVMITDGNWEDPEPIIVFANPAFCEMTGFSLDELIGKSPGILYGVKTDQVPRSRIEHDLQTSGAAMYQTVYYRKDRQEFLVESRVQALLGPSRTIANYIVFQRDVTERNRLREQMQQAQKMEAVGRLAGGIAHDFNNILTIILGHVGLLSSELSRNTRPGGKLLRSVTEIQLASERAAALTSQLLAFSRKQVVQTRVIDLNPVISNMEGMLRRLLGEDVDLELSLGEGGGSLQADNSQLEQVLMNLAVNARDAMPNGGMLTIETRNAEITSRYAPVTSLPAGQYVELSISDTGTGMDEETKAHVFEPFFTTKEPGRGTGLGLSMVYGFVAQNGGSIEVRSEPGMGTRFDIYLPRVGSAAEVSAEVTEFSFPRGSGVILVVEDELGIRELIREILEDRGYDVLTAADAAQAIGIASLQPDPIDLLLTDVVLPGTSGVELAQRLKALRPTLRVLFASGYSDHALLRQGDLERGAAFIQKPFAAETLLAAIRNLLGVKASTQAN